jgi:hypothetical protein
MEEKMLTKAADPVRPISFTQAANITLDNYYDLLKLSVGGLQADEYLQLKLVADPVDFNDDDANKGGYRWWSYYNFLNRADLVLVTNVVNDSISVSAAKLSRVYGQFLDKLITYVSIINLPPGDQKTLADIAVSLKSLQDNNEALSDDDDARWTKFAKKKGYSTGDQARYAQWAENNGNWETINSNIDQMNNYRLQRKIILDRQFPDKEDRDIKDASKNYDNMFMQLGYPVWPDYLYTDGMQFSVNYLSTFAGTSNALFDSRRTISPQNITLKRYSYEGCRTF